MSQALWYPYKGQNVPRIEQVDEWDEWLVSCDGSGQVAYSSEALAIAAVDYQHRERVAGVCTIVKRTVKMMGERLP